MHYTLPVRKGSANVKGSIVRSRLDVLRNRGVFDQVMALLPESDRAVWTGIVLAVSWYSFEMSQRLDVATAKVLGGGDTRKAYLEMGRASAEANLSSVHKAYVRTGQPHHLLSCAPQIYKQYYDKGHRTYEQVVADERRAAHLRRRERDRQRLPHRRRLVRARHRAVRRRRRARQGDHVSRAR